MPQGLIIRNANNQVVMDTTTRSGRLLGFGSTGTGNGSISPPGADQGELFYVVLSGHDNFNLYDRPLFGNDAWTIWWDWGSSPSHKRQNYDFVYGVR